MKCDNCLNARRVISENGLHSICCLSEKVATDCIMGKKDQRVPAMITPIGDVNDRESCEYRHENGNCLKVGGFCTSVDNEHCVKGGKE